MNKEGRREQGEDVESVGGRGGGGAGGGSRMYGLIEERKEQGSQAGTEIAKTRMEERERFS